MTYEAAVPLRRIATMNMGETILAEECSGEGFPIYSASVGPNAWAYSDHVRRLNRRGTLVISARGTIGAPRLPLDPLFANTQTTIALAPGPTTDSRFLRYALLLQDWVEITEGMGIPMLTVGALSSVTVPHPSVGRQRAIADFLDRETAQIDAFIAKNEQLIALLTERRMAVLRVATSIGIERNREVVDSGITELGVIAAGWRLMRLSLLFGSTGSGTTPPAELVLDTDEADVPWVTTSELREARISTTLRGVSARTLAATPALKVHPKGSLLLAMYGATIGRTAILGVPAASNQAVCALSRPRDCDVQYVEYALQAGRERLMLEAVGGGQPNINQEAVRAFRIPVPPLAEQRAIVTDIATKTTAIDSGVAAAKRAIDLARERRAALISAAVTGKIDVGVDA